MEVTDAASAQAFVDAWEKTQSQINPGRFRRIAHDMRMNAITVRRAQPERAKNFEAAAVVLERAAKTSHSGVAGWCIPLLPQERVHAAREADPEGRSTGLPHGALIASRSRDLVLRRDGGCT